MENKTVIIVPTFQLGLMTKNKSSSERGTKLSGGSGVKSVRTIVCDLGGPQLWLNGETEILASFKQNHGYGG